MGVLFSCYQLTVCATQAEHEHMLGNFLLHKSSAVQFWAIRSKLEPFSHLSSMGCVTFTNVIHISMCVVCLLLIVQRVAWIWLLLLALTSLDLAAVIGTYFPWFGCCYWHLLPWIWLLLLVLTSLDVAAVIGTYFPWFGCCYWYLLPWMWLLLLVLTSLDVTAVIGTYFPGFGCCYWY